MNLIAIDIGNTNIGIGLFLKGREAEAEVAAASKLWNFEAELHPSLTDTSGRIVVIRALNAKTEGHSR